ncbi:MAG: mechanosensitive ion channel family protein [Peptococcaceae bacterium]|nr:mechanosensitive ion channel family protein [Peptococcaceae bacterium]
MIDCIKSWFLVQGLSDALSSYWSNGVIGISILLLAVAVFLIVDRLLSKAVKVYALKSRNNWGEILLEKKVFGPLAYIAPLLLIQIYHLVFPFLHDWVQKLLIIGFILIVLIVFNRLLDAVDDIYRNFEISRTKPIKGYLQVVKILFNIIMLIIIISIIINRSPLILLSGIGAATAIILLIFRDFLLGLVASIQLIGNDMVRLGDWIEMPSSQANGNIVDISLYTVKVQNFDKTITTIPTYSLISKPFNNWRGMEESGGRRIKRSICIDFASIKICTEEMPGRFMGIGQVRRYLERKQREAEHIDRLNNSSPTDKPVEVQISNIGLFRAYIQEYLKNHPGIRQDMTLIVRQLQPNESGLPIEICAFVNETEWDRYEEIQGDIFDHLFTVVSEFELRIYQKPSGDEGPGKG